MMELSLIYKFGPCGLFCERCFAFKRGPIRFHARKLRSVLGNFDRYAERFVLLLDNPRFGKYDDFKMLLETLATSDCMGCRSQDCQVFSGCLVKKCYMDKSVDFCFQCNEFPCNRTGFDEDLTNRWKSINLRIREVGLETYYNEVKDKPRYH